MKKAFQAWAKDHVGQPDFSGFHGTGGVWVYRHNIMQLMWLCWQAATSTTDILLPVATHKEKS